MSPTTEKVLESAMALSNEERDQLVESCSPNVISPWPDRLAMRGWARSNGGSAEIDAGTAVLTPWSEVKRRVRQRVESG